MPIPKAKQAVVEDAKLSEYLLNANHPEGGSKAAWLYSLGYRLDEPHHLQDDLLKIARNCDNFVTETSPFGVKYKASGFLGRPRHRPGSVLTIWIAENGTPPRFVTTYPDQPS